MKFTKVSFLLLLMIAVVAFSNTTSYCQTPRVEYDVTPTRVVPPIYPAVALAKGSEGLVVIEVQISATGDVKRVETVDGPRLLHDVAKAAAARWKFNSISSHGVRTVKLSFEFTIRKESTSSSELVPIFLPPFKIEIFSVKSDLVLRVDSDPPSNQSP